MKFIILALLAFMTLCSHPLLANAATYHWYFSNDKNGNAVGNDSNSCLDGTSNACKTLQKAENMMKVKKSDDVVYLYFDRGDTWNFSTNVYEVFSVETGDPTVHIRAYGTGNRPVFQGEITDFSTADDDGDNNYWRYNRVFHFEVENCSIDDIEIKNVYGNAIFLVRAHGFTLSNSLIHNVGSSCIVPSSVNGEQGIEDVTVQYNTCHTAMQLHPYGKIGAHMWSQCLSLYTDWDSNENDLKNNLVQYNLVYDCGGEGIVAPNSVIEYNVVGDTSSIGIDAAVADYDAYDATVRYNMVIMSDWSTSIYDDPEGSPDGIRVFDESDCSPTCYGDNSAANIEIYGNIVINRRYGIRVYNNADIGNPFGSVKIYNNLVIDSHAYNIYIADPSEFKALTFYNNSSILYDRASTTHAASVTAPGGWDIDYNHFWTTGGSPSVPRAWQANHVINDPKLPGEPALDWDGLTGKNYFHMIDFTNHLYIPPDSGLANAGKILGSGYNSMFLTAGTDFRELNFQKISQPNSPAPEWYMGPIVPKKDSGGITSWNWFKVVEDPDPELDK